MITSDGWFDWAERLEPTVQNVNPGINAVRGLFMHSAEGYASVLLDPRSSWGYNGDLSWHATNLLDGRFIQHYPLTARCWHATEANDDYVGFENEGFTPEEPSLNGYQIDNAVRAIRDLAAWKGWTPSRPRSETDTAFTLWEHNEVVRLGGSDTECPSGRIPWDEILALLEDEMMNLWTGEANPAFWANRTVNGNQGWGVRDDFGLPDEAASVEVEVFLKAGGLTLMHGGTGEMRAGFLGGPGVNHFRVYLDAEGSAWMAGDNAIIDKLVALGYFTS